MSKPVRFALAGFGAWGKFHAQSIAANPDAQLVAIAAPSEASREEARRLHPGAQIFSDSAAMIAEADFDIIDIATPSHTHPALAVAAMERGKHVLLEKPMATTLDDCKTIVAAALPTIGLELGDFADSPWIVTAYLVAATTVTLPGWSVSLSTSSV